MPKNRKFVILLHTDRISHYDLLIEKNKALTAYRISFDDLDILIGGEEIEAEVLSDHRKKYLSYEGPVEGRGRVDIYDSGEIKDEITNDDGSTILINGKKANGRLRIEKIDDVHVFLKFLVSII
jgi:hypothetical protein